MRNNVKTCCCQVITGGLIITKDLHGITGVEYIIIFYLPFISVTHSHLLSSLVIISYLYFYYFSSLAFSFSFFACHYLLSFLYSFFLTHILIFFPRLSLSLIFSLITFLHSYSHFLSSLITISILSSLSTAFHLPSYITTSCHVESKVPSVTPEINHPGQTHHESIFILHSPLPPLVSL